MLWLTRLRPNPRVRAVRRDLREPYEMHRTLAKAIALSTLPPADARARLTEARMLFRVEQLARTSDWVVLVQSRIAPDWSAIANDDYLVREPEQVAFEPIIRAGNRLAFRLRANPTVKRNGRRFGLYDEREQADWLRRKAERGGFIVEQATPRIESRMSRSPGKGESVEHLAVRFDGTLVVRDSLGFAESIASGIGSAKGFGFGLLSVARPQG